MHRVSSVDVRCIAATTCIYEPEESCDPTFDNVTKKSQVSIKKKYWNFSRGRRIFHRATTAKNWKKLPIPLVFTTKVLTKTFSRNYCSKKQAFDIWQMNFSRICKLYFSYEKKVDKFLDDTDWTFITTKLLTFPSASKDSCEIKKVEKTLPQQKRLQFRDLKTQQR